VLRYQKLQGPLQKSIMLDLVLRLPAILILAISLLN